MAEAYVEQYRPNCSFKFFFDGLEHPRIGTSKKVVKAVFKSSQEVFERIFTESSLGLGGCYCKGQIQVRDEDYKAFLSIFVSAACDNKIIKSLSWPDAFRLLRARSKHVFFTSKSARKDLNSHYSLNTWFSNEDDANKFYLYWLDPKYVQYTCAIWYKDTKTLEEAQRNKFELYAKALGINKNSKGKKLLDLGCGWGGPMFYLSQKYGVVCEGINLSTAQAKYVNDEGKRRKLPVTCKNISAHDISGQYDYILSIGMLEHIKDYDDLFQKSSKCLKPDGKALFHAVYNYNRFDKTDTFLSKYIFPGAKTPNFAQTMQRLKRYFKHIEEHPLPPGSYSKTLDCWYRVFCKEEKNIRHLLKTKGKCEDVDYAIRTFKHYLVMCSIGHALTNYMHYFVLSNADG